MLYKKIIKNFLCLIFLNPGVTCITGGLDGWNPLFFSDPRRPYESLRTRREIFPVSGKGMESLFKVGTMIQPLIGKTVFFKERPLILFLLSYAAGIMLGNFTALSWHIAACFLLVSLAGLLLAFRCKRDLPGFLALHFCLLLTGVLGIASYTATGSGETDPIPRHQYDKIVYRGFIDETPQMAADRTEYILSGVRFLENNDSQRVPGRVLLSAGGADALKYGDYVQFRTRLAVPRNFNNPGGFDYRKYLNQKGILYRGTVSESPDLILIRRNLGNPIKTGIEAYRDRLREFVNRNTAPPEREILLAMMLGEQKTIPDDLKERFNRTGTSHILAISGFNVGMIAFFSVLFFRSLLKIYPRLLLMWSGTKVAYTLSLVPILLYAGVAGMGISVIRATIMVVVLMTAILIRRPKDLLNALALAAIIILGLSPSSLYDPSFQLSFAAVAAILFIPPRLQMPTSDRKAEDEPLSLALTRKAWRNFYLFLLVSASATLGTLPIIAYHFQSLSTVVLPTNMAVVPFLGILTTPICLLVIVLYPLSETICLFLLQGAAYLIQISVFFVNFFSSLPGSSFLVPPPGWIDICVYYLLLLISTLYMASLMQNHSPNARKEKPRTALPIRAGILILIPLLAGIVLYGYLSASPSKYLKFTVLDVGQGNCALIRLPGGKTLLIDGGGFEGSSFDVGRYVVAPFLLREKIRKIDVVVLTHPHPDHLNGLLYILKNFAVGEVWSNGDRAPYESYKCFQKIIGAKQIPHRFLHYGQADRQIDRLRISVLNPLSPDFDCTTTPCDFNDINNRSLVLYLRFGNIRILLPGDIAAETEARLAAIPDHMKSHIILAPHHGGRTSSTEAFLAKVQPTVSVVSCGLDNRYKDPHPDVIARYKNKGAKIYRTDHDGAVMLLTDGNRLWDGKGTKILP